MIHQITDWIMGLLQQHGAMSVFVGVIIESVIVPIPSPLIIMGAGAILIPTDISWGQAAMPIFMKIVLPGTVASTLGAFLGYGLGYWGGKPVIEKFKNFIGFGWDDVLSMEHRFIGHRAGWMIFILRALPIVPLSLISAAAGGLRVPVWNFTLWTFLGSIPRCLFLAYLGWLMHDTYTSIAQRFNKLESLVSASIVLIACALVLWLRWRMKKSEPA